MSHYIIFSDGTFDYHIDDEGILVVTTDELDENAIRNQVHTIGLDDMEAFIGWLTTEFRKRKIGLAAKIAKQVHKEAPVRR